ncbi:hypothetical protein SPI_04330 [Niveomyces insectorum RCEF 264]|uniref:Uncharacterized protein n=1 Tax=Niveomyces insectorum RCEF 264 TaxID=1081102 RepID=A0A167VML3_9HYPO|nr:hypothetical protein SPI_04330 [Niveomyces insectorum RCEF 264]
MLCFRRMRAAAVLLGLRLAAVYALPSPGLPPVSTAAVTAAAVNPVFETPVAGPLPTADVPTAAASSSLLTATRSALAVDAAGAGITRTIVRSNTATSVSYPAWIDATVITMITTQTVTTLISDEDATVVETVIGKTTYEYQMTYSDGHSSTSWSSATHMYTSTLGS